MIAALRTIDDSKECDQAPARKSRLCSESRDPVGHCFPTPLLIRPGSSRNPHRSTATRARAQSAHDQRGCHYLGHCEVRHTAAGHHGRVRLIGRLLIRARHYSGCTIPPLAERASCARRWMWRGLHRRTRSSPRQCRRYALARSDRIVTYGISGFVMVSVPPVYPRTPGSGRFTDAEARAQPSCRG